MIFRNIRICIICLFFTTAVLQTYSETLSYDYTMDLGKNALSERKYDDAVHYFNLAHILNPSSDEPLVYINLIKRLKEDRVEPITPAQKDKVPVYKIPPSEKRLSEEEAKDTLPKKKFLIPSKLSPEEKIKHKEKTVDDFLNLMHTKEKKRKEKIKKVISAIEKGKGKIPLEKIIPEKKKKKKEIETAKKEKMLVLTDDIWSTQPKTTVEVEVFNFITIKGKDVKRFLVVSPEFAEAERIDADTIKIIGIRKGSIFIHLWDNKGRWTFTVNVVFPAELAALSEREKIIEKGVSPFKLSYSVSGNSFYKGKRLGTFNKQSSGYSQWAGIRGDTPYGIADSSAAFTSFKEKAKVTTHTSGLTGGKIGPFRNFNIRGFDTSKNLSPLTLPGGSIRGVTLDGAVFKNKLRYDFLKGKEKTVFGEVTPGVEEKKEAFLEGAKITLFPSEKDKYSFNFARGYGTGRESFLNDKVFSLETEQLFGDLKLSSESAYDEDKIAIILNSFLRKGDFSFGLNLRNIEKDFTTITGRPSDRGEIGSKVSIGGKISRVDISSNLDVYRDRFLFNTGKPHELNFDWDTSLSFPFTTSSNWMTNFSYINNPGLLSPRKDFRVSNTYTERFKIFNEKDMSIFLGNSYQRNRNSLSPESDYDRYGISGGGQIYLIKDLAYYLNYNYYLIKEIVSEVSSTPRVLNTGINYYKKITPLLTGKFNISYRDEEKTEGTRSFLAGEDSLDISLGFDYNPSKDWNFFIDGRVRDVWAENSNREAFNEADVRWGVRSHWDLPFIRWNPKGVIKGTVFNDVNGDGKKDKDEKGIQDIKINAGKRTVTTDKLGEYKAGIRAVSVMVSVDSESVPRGYVFSTPTSYDADIAKQNTHIVNFGVTIQSGIYGVVFYDVNANGKPDGGDEFIPNTKVILDKGKSTVSNFEGGYSFKNVAEGKHDITIDVNSLPKNYLPLIKLKNEINLAEGTSYIFNIPVKKK